jgi:hypothetical protein
VEEKTLVLVASKTLDATFIFVEYDEPQVEMGVGSGPRSKKL